MSVSTVHHLFLIIDKRPDETTCATTPQYETVPIEEEEHTTCPPLECDCTRPSTEVNNTECTTPGTESIRRDDTEKVPSIALGGGLGTLVVVLILLLVGVVLGWVWSCHRNKNK